MSVIIKTRKGSTKYGGPHPPSQDNHHRALSERDCSTRRLGAETTRRPSVIRRRAAARVIAWARRGLSARVVTRQAMAQAGGLESSPFD